MSSVCTSEFHGTGPGVLRCRDVDSLSTDEFHLSFILPRLERPLVCFSLTLLSTSEDAAEVEQPAHCPDPP